MSTTTTRAVEAATRLADECKKNDIVNEEFIAKIDEDYEFVVRELTRLRAALEAIDEMKPEDFMTGQAHLTPAFRTVNFADVFEHVCGIVNGMLYGTDANGNPLPEEAK